MARNSLTAALAVFCAAIAGACAAQPAAPPAAPVPAQNDYGAQANWLCWPGRAGDACAVDLAATIVRANGTTTVEHPTAEADPAVDCFYVYPTVSRDRTALSDMIPGREEREVVAAQLARFGLHCRLYAPMYRQFTLTALVALMSGQPIPGGGAGVNFETGYTDVVAAWNWYLAHENHGRGVVLIGHSQGALVLTQLIAREIDGRPAQRLLVSALLLGSPVPVPRGADVGGAFQHIPLCRLPGQTGCVISYSAFRDTATPGPATQFARARAPGQTAACTNPANLAAGRGGDATSYFNIAGAPAWTTIGAPITTQFVSTPGLITARCVDDGTFNYLSIHINADPADPRTDDIFGDVMQGGQRDRAWGLHLIDTGLFMGDLVDIVTRQSAAWRAAHR